jgi:hypothetical protein
MFNVLIFIYAFTFINTAPVTQTEPPKVFEQKVTQQQIETYICSKNWDCETAKQIAFCESSFNPKSKHPVSSASGLFQFTDGTWVWTREKMGRNTTLALKTDYKENADTAYYLYKLYGFASDTTWNASRVCWD